MTTQARPSSSPGRRHTSGSCEKCPALGRLHWRHRGVTFGICAAFREAAAVCFGRHHDGRRARLLVSLDARPQQQFLVEWSVPSQRLRDAWASHVDSTECAAYGVALALAEAHLGLYAVRRAFDRSSVDYYLTRTSLRDGAQGVSFEDAVRLEVSGTDADTQRKFSERVGVKLRQARRGASNLPAMAGVVGFRLLRVAFRTV